MTVEIRKRRCVYIVHGVGTKYYKIGKTANIKTRLSGLRVASPLEIKLIAIHYIDNNTNLETSLHEKFQHVQRGSSEWFELSIEDIEFLLLETDEILHELPLLEHAPQPTKKVRSKPRTQNLPLPYPVINLTPRLPEMECVLESEAIETNEAMRKEEKSPPRLIRVAKDEKIAAKDLPSISDEFQYGLLPEIRELYEELGTWEAVGKHYGVSKGIAWQIANNEVMPGQNELRRKLGLCTIYSVQDYIPEGVQ